MIAAGLAYFVKPGDSKDPGGPYSGIYYGKDAPDFTLSDQEGNPVSISSFEGKEVLLSFGYTSCPDICPTTLMQLNSVTQKLGGKESPTRLKRRQTPIRFFTKGKSAGTRGAFIS